MPPGNEDRKRRQGVWLSNAYGLGLAFPTAIGVGVAFGWWLDKMFGTRPWLMVVFGTLGVIAAFVNLFRVGMADDGTGK